MEIVIHDNTLKTVAVINNDISMLPSFFNDNWHRYKDQGAETFIFTVNKFINGQLQDYCRFLNEQAYISFTYDGIDHLFGVENVQESDYQITLTCSSLNLELRNEQANTLVNTSSHNIQWYFDTMGLISNAQITIGTNEVSSLTRTINYDGQESKLARLISVIGNFDAEFEFITHLNDDGTLDSIILNIYRANDGVNAQGVGTNRNDVSLNFGKNISGITRTGDTTNLFNATTITGTDSLSWKRSNFSYINDDGVEEFYKRAGDNTAYAPLSLNLFKSQIKSNASDRWIRKDFQTEYTNVNDMWGYCVSQFKQFAYPTVTYEVLANSSLVLESVGNDRPLSIGDTINIQDDNFMDSDGNVGLLLSARVSEMEISFSNPALNKITFSNFKKQQSEASADIQAIVNQLVDAATPYRAELTTTNGTQFKNGTGSTTLSAHIYKGSATTETIADSYEWSKDGTIVANAQTIIVDASGVANKAVYSFKAIVAGKVVASQSVTITNVNDGAKGAQGPQGPQGLKGDPGATGIPGQAGADGKTSYLHIAYATNSTGTAGFDVSNATGKTYIGQYTDFTSADSTDPSKYTWSLIKGDKGDKGDTGNDGRAGKDGVGINSTTITYAISSSGTVTPTTSWTSQVPTLVKGQYLWTKTVWNYSDTTSETGYTVTYIAKDGNNGNDGIAGKDGVGISNTTIEYVGAVSGTSKPTSGWSTTIPTVTAGSFLWTRTTLTYTDNTTEQVFSVAKMGNTGATGPKGDPGNQGIPGTPGVDGRTPYTHWAYANSADGTLDFNPDYKSAVGLDILNIINWAKNTSMSGSTYKFSSNADSSFKVAGKGTGGYEVLSKSFPAKIGDKLRFTVRYTNRLAFGLYNNYGLQFVTSEAYTESVTSTSKIVLPNVITASTEYQLEYTATTSNIWMQLNFGGVADGAQVDFDVKIEVENLTNPVKYAYMGTYSDYTANDSTVPTDYKWSRILGADGANGTDGIAGKDGKGIKATAITYQASTNGTTAPTGTWSASVPTVAKGSFLWTRTIWTYTDNITETGYAVAYMGTNGNNGTDGIAGKDGVGIQTTTITYAGSTSGTTAPTSGWTSTVPTVAAGNYLWTKTVWAYTDNTSETGYSVAKMGNTGPTGPSGVDGDPGKVVSDIEPTTRFKGLTWKYSGTTDLTASDGTVILSGTEYYWSGTKWILNEINSHNINGDNLNVTNGTFTDGKIKSIWNSGVLSGSTEIENSYINMSATDSTSKATNGLGLDVQRGFGMRWIDPNSNQSKSVSLNYGNLGFNINGVVAGLNFDGTNLSSSMPIQAPNTIIKSTQYTISGVGIRLDRMMSFVAVTFSGQATSTISSSQTIKNVLPVGFRPITPSSIDYMIPGNTANNGYIYFNPDGSIMIMGTINSGYYIRGTRLYITSDVYPS